MKHSLDTFITALQADELVCILRRSRNSVERCESVKRYLLTLAEQFPAGVTVDDVAYEILSKAEHKQNGTGNY